MIKDRYSGLGKFDFYKNNMKYLKVIMKHL